MKKVLLLFSLFFCIAMTAEAQRTISGKVTDTKGDPLVGASVVVKGTTVGTITDINGLYTLVVQNGQNTLEYSYTGYTTQIREIGLSNVIDMSLTEGVTLGETVVTALGVKRQDKALGYSVSTIDGGAITQRSEPDPLKALSGKVAGVDIRTSQGTPGSATRINLRGNTSFFGNNEPLIVVDGIPFNNTQVTTNSQTSGGGAYSNGFSSIDPNDIASITVLKGAAAAALYGSRASNGALIITTKSGSDPKGKKGIQVSYTANFAIEKIANLPEYQNEYGAGNLFTYSNANGSWGPKFGTIDSIPTWPNYLTAFPNMGKNVAYKAYPNNVSDLFQNGKVNEHSVTFGGDNGASFFSSTISYLNQTGYVPESQFKRANFSLGGGTRLDMGLNVSGSFSYSNSDQFGGIFGENQVDGAASSFARNLFLARNWDLNLPYEDVNGLPVSTNNAQYDNPRWSWKHNTVSTNTDRYTAMVRLDYDIFSWLNASYQIGNNTNNLFRREVIDIGSRAAEGKGRIDENNYRHSEIESNFLITIKPKPIGDFGIRATVGHNVNQRKSRDETVRGSQIVAADIYTLQNTNSQSILNQYQFTRRLWGIFGEISADYKNLVFLTLTGRNDHSSTLPKDNNSYFYPSASLSFSFTEALKIDPGFFYGKLRASWAKVGRDADPYSLQNVFLVNSAFTGIPNASVSPTSKNNELKPEFTVDKEIGAQLDFFKRRVSLDVAIYKRVSTNQIAPVTVPASSGFTQSYLNFGELTNKGIEIDLKLVPYQRGNLTWDIHGVFTKYTSVVTKLIDGVDRIQLNPILTEISPYLEVGKPFGYLRGSVDYRDDQGNLLIDRTTGMLIRSTEQTMIGNPIPDYKAGIGTSLTWKKLRLGILFDYTHGGDIYSVTVNSLLGRGVTTDTKDREDGFVIPGYYGDAQTGKPLLDENGNKIKNSTVLSMNELYFGETFAVNSATEWNVYDATILTLREVSLSYDLPSEWFKKTKLSGISLVLSGRNLWYIAPNMPKGTNFNPEANSFGATTTQGIELSAAPTTKRFGISLNVRF